MHVSAALVALLLSGCSAPNGPEITVPLQAHALESCPSPDPALLDLAALGDFPITMQTSESLSIDASGTKLSFPAETLALEAKASGDIASSPFIGFSERIAGRLDFLLWPEATTCELFRPTAVDAFPGKLGGEASGYSDTTGLVMFAGSNDASSAAVVGALTFDTRTGETHVVDPRVRAVLSEPRAFATVTDFAGEILVAGGENPVHDASLAASDLRGTAEVYDPTTQSFGSTLIELAEPITRQAATTLLNGETVLLGGRDEALDASNVVQVVSPGTQKSTLLEPLSVGRDSPDALRLDDGRIFIAGGTDADGKPISALEWRDTDASPLTAPWDGSTSLSARYDRAFAALPGGGVLAVGGCEDRAPLSGEDCTVWCAHGCPPNPDPNTSQSYDAYWVGADGSVTALDFPLTAPQPILIPGSDGAPWLVATAFDQNNQPIPGSFALYRFDPWQKSFTEASADLGFDSDLSPAHLVPTGLDAFVWLTTDSNGPVLHGARLGTRSAFASDGSLLGDSTRPAHLAPDHPPNGDVSYDGALHFAQLTDNEAANCVWVDDSEYADFSAQITFASDSAPALRLGSQPVTAANSSHPSSPCQLPALSKVAASTSTITLRRDGVHITVSDASASSQCDLDTTLLPTRVPFGVCQSELGAVTVTQITVTRGD